MADIINLLPDAVANQIAAGEVIQRPASVVKELVENAVDAGSTIITVNIKDAGKTLIQVVDNGKGMSETDARLCWERHATSKIKSALDLFAIQTKGFRGEALSSIASIAEVTLKTRTEENELGVQIKIAASEIQSNQQVACTVGSNFSVKNLFYNVPARRKFLKANSTELRYIINDFNRIALAHSDIEFNLFHNNSQVLNLPASNPRQRILNVLGKNLNQSLIPLETKTTLINIKGFIGKPEFAKKTFGEQFFFVNNRYIRHPYFHKAVVQAYENIISSDSIPSYFIFFEIDPDKIDINIHPTKTEIKFEDEQAIWQILMAVVRESIGKNNLSPSLDFSIEGVVDIPVLRRNTEIFAPKINLNPNFNPFDNDREDNFNLQKQLEAERRENWQALFESGSRSQKNPDSIFANDTGQIKDGPRLLQFKNKYILSPVKSGLMIIDQKRAHERILYENTLRVIASGQVIEQKTLFPETLELNSSDFVLFKELEDDFRKIGFDIREFGNNSVIVHGLPDSVKYSDIKDLIESIFQNYKSIGIINTDKIHDNLAKSMAKASAIPYGKVLEMQEMRELTDQLFACGNPNLSPSGKKIISIINTEDIEKTLL
ncbi:MAG: DNA mismatch repair endonuclease MutL [Bacteroidales bacterium]|nr:DNA mismatch repair endonuclease MutL [Bacteroidales bacterium]MCF8389144.1 DNA mismatch repair endonuclease MutL [Bacteroidales bacterium]